MENETGTQERAGSDGSKEGGVIFLDRLTADARQQVELLCSDNALGEKDLLGLVMVRCMALYRGSKRESISKFGPVYESLWDAGGYFDNEVLRNLSFPVKAP